MTCTATIYVTTAQAAWDCIKGIQLNVNDTTQLLDWLVPYLGFQSTLTYLKDPPPSYERPPVDILGGIQDLKNEVINGTFTNQYDFDVALKRLMTSTLPINGAQAPGFVADDQRNLD